MRGSERFAEALTDVAFVSYAALVFFALLEGAEFGLRVRHDEEVRAYREFSGAYIPGRLFRIPSVLRKIVERIGIFTFLEHTDINPIRAWVAFRTAGCIDRNGQLPFRHSALSG